MNKNNNSPVSVSYDKTSENFKIKIGKMIFLSTEDDSFRISEPELKGIHISSFPTSVGVVPVDIPDDSFYGSLTITNNGNGRAAVDISVSEKYFSYPDNIGAEAFFKLKIGKLLTLTQLNPVVEAFYPDNNYIIFDYSIQLPADKIQNIIKKAIAFDNDLNEEVMQAVPDTYEIARVKLGLPDTEIQFIEQ